MSLDFFELIYGESEGFISIATRDDSQQTSGAWEINSEKWFYWPEERNRIERYISVRDDEDVYNSVAMFSAQARTKMDREARSRVVYVDADTCAPEKFRITPTISVQTSKGKWHCYWVLDREIAAHEASRLSRRICVTHADEGCDRGFQVSKLLRVPGTSNTKYGTPFKVDYTTTGVLYTPEEIEEAYSEIHDEAGYVVESSLPEPVLGKAYRDLEARLDAAGLSSLYLEMPPEGTSWSQRAYRLELELFRIGMTTAEVYSIMRNAAVNKYNPEHAGQLTATGVPIPHRANHEQVLWEEVQKAYAEYLESENVITEPTEARDPRQKREFITLEERRWVHDHPTWIQEYTDWVATKTDSAEAYQRSFAYGILSACFSGRGKVSTPYGQFGLNLWFLSVGESTHDRKTTAMIFAKSIVTGFTRVMNLEVPISVGSDFTKEAILKTLGVPERDHKSALVHIDEVNGFFNEVFQKSYRAGTLETLTDLYGGEVPQSMRAGKDAGNPYQGHTNLSFWGMGIEKKVASLLSREHFESGFLARMLWTVADAPARKKNSNAMVFLDTEQTKQTFDKSRLRMIQKIQTSARRFPEDPTKVIAFDREATARLNEWIELATQIMEKHDESELIGASVVRMFTSAAKCAALLAMYEGRDVVQVGDILHVLEQCERWFRDLERMAGNIANSDYEVKLEEVIHHIANQRDHKILESTLRKKFARYREREFTEMIESLKKQGRIRAIPGQAQTLEAIDD